MKFEGLLVVVAATAASAICPMGKQMLDSLMAEGPNSRLERRQLPSTFNENQRVDVTGVHAYIPPGPNDLRGPCPGLNAMANHGYLPRNGVTTLLGAAQASNLVYGLNLGGGLALSAAGTVLTGDPISQKWSIGGTPPSILGLLPLGRPQGISNSHNKYEGDASASRGDAYLHGGDATSLRIQRFKALYDLAKDDPEPDYNLDVIAKHRKYTFNLSKSTNPYFFYGPFSSLVVATGAHALIPALFSNHSAARPEGILEKETLKSFFAITEAPDGSLSWTPGSERIPDVWYRRPLDPTAEYAGPELALDLIRIWQEAPESLTVGGNTGQVNSFKGVDLSDLTGSVYSTSDLLDPTQLTCFLYQITLAVIPDILRSELLGSVLTAALGLVDDYVRPLVDPNCVPINNYDDSSLGQFPGRALRK